MRTAQDLLRELNSLDESHRIEAKLGSAIDKSAMESICAFSNEPGLGGGYLLLGVVSDQTDLFGKTYRVVGVDDPDKIQSDLVSQCSSKLNRRVRPTIQSESLNGKTVIVVFVPEAPATEKPIFISNIGLPRGAYRRVGPSDVEGTEDDLIALYAGHQIDTYDGAILADADLDDIDPQALSEYRRMRSQINPMADELEWSDNDLLRALGCAKLEKGELKPTAAGILLFGTGMAIRRCFPMMRIDYIRVPGRKWVEDPDHRFDTLEIRAPLFTAIRRATNTVRDELIHSFSLPEGALSREDEPALPFRVIREAIVNAVMHRSYRIHGAIQIIRYANRLEIRNPGHSLKAEEQLGEPGSETRNPRIAAVLHEVNIAETKGSGIRAMRQLMLENDLLPPTFESSRRPDQFVATFLFHHFLGPEDLEWLRRLTSSSLNDEESRALVFVREVGAIDNAAYRSINRTDTLDASNHLRRLRDLGLLSMKGSGNRTYYVPGERFEAQMTRNRNSHQPSQDSHQPGQDSHQPSQDSHQLGQDSHQPGQDSHQPGQDSHQLHQDSHQLHQDSHQLHQDSHQLSNHIPEELRDRIPARGTKPRREVMRELIIDLCTFMPLSARELAELLGREQKVLVRDYLTPMVAEGLLAYTISEMENHPDQRYTLPTSED